MAEVNKSGHPRLLDYILWDGQTPLHSIDFIAAPNPPLKGQDTYNSRGVKTESNLTGSRDGEVCVKRVFTERYEDKELDIQFQWINDDGSIFCIKDKTVSLSEAQWQSRFRKQREFIFDDIKGRAKTFNAEHYVDILYSYFKEEKQDFVETGSPMFKDAVLETLQIDVSGLGAEEQQVVGTVQTILNESLDGQVKIHETLVYLTSL